MHIKTYIQLFGILSALFLTTACQEDFDKENTEPTQLYTVKAEIGSFSINGENVSLPNENDVNDIQACLFEAGKMTEVYTHFLKENDLHILQIDKQSGHLYILSNLGNRLNLENLKNQGIAEADWQKITLPASESSASDFSSEMIDLSKNESNPHSVTLKRGVARFDLNINTDKTVQVEQIVLKNMTKQSFLFQQTPVSTPENSGEHEIVIEFPQALENSTRGVAYVYEQVGTNLAASIRLQVEGKTKTVETKLPATLKRNTVYTLDIDIDSETQTVTINVIEWENGGNHTLSPEANHLKIDIEASKLPENVMVNSEKNLLILPYTATDLTLAVESDDELEFVPEAMPLTVETMGGSTPETEGKNLFRIQKERWRPGVPAVTIQLRFHRKGLHQTYPDDYLTLVLTENPTKIEGFLDYTHSHTYDFERYIDNELGVLTLPESKILTVEYEEGEDSWIKLDKQTEAENTFRVLGGWKPNDPTANGREQKATLVICNTDGTEREEYLVVRRNWGLPVTYLYGIWWCKYNAMGNSKDFNDQILSSNDPAVKAGKSLFDYLQDCTPEEYFNLWKWQYQGKSTQGLQVIDENGVAKMAGYGTSNIHINKLEPTAMAPDGYELPSMENFERVLNSTSGTIWLMWDGSHTTAWTPAGSNIQRRNRRRNDVSVGTVEMTDLIYIQMYDNLAQQHEPLVWYGPGSQWDTSGIHHGHYNAMLWATYSPDNGEGWFYRGSMAGLYPGKNNAGPNDTRILRFKKSDVEYIYE